jgi:hypothetical protein
MLEKQLEISVASVEMDANNFFLMTLLALR